MYISHIQGVHHIHHLLSQIPTMSASRKSNELAARNEDEDLALSLVTSDLVSLLKGKYAGEVVQFVCYKKGQSVGQCVQQGFQYIRSRPCPEGFRNQENSPMGQLISFLSEFFNFRRGSMDKDQD